jgi:hypothetical protein
MTTKRLRMYTLTVLVVFLGAGCAKTSVTSRRSHAPNEKLPRPGRVIVYNFASYPGDIEADPATREYWETHANAQTDDQIKLGRMLGEKVAEALVKEILNMGMPAERAKTGPPPSAGNLLIKGEFVTIDEGDRMKRMLIGFGAGAAELKSLVEIYQVTADGSRFLASGEVATKGGRMPGMLVPVAGGVAAKRAGQAALISGTANVAKELGPESLGGAAQRTAQEIAKELSEAFWKQGWID